MVGKKAKAIGWKRHEVILSHWLQALEPFHGVDVNGIPIHQDICP
jgi:hypothetical protein